MEPAFSTVLNFVLGLLLRLVLWWYFRSHDVNDFKWLLVKAGFQVFLIGPNYWRWTLTVNGEKLASLTIRQVSP